MTISKFGQKVELQVFDSGKRLVFSSNGLRVDFNVQNDVDFTRATVKIWNMGPKDISAVQNGECYCRVVATLHDDSPMVVMDDFYISNSMNETILPNSVTTLYTFSKTRKDFLEKTVSFNVKNPTLENVMRHVVQETGFKGKVIYKNFPQAMLDYAPPRPSKDRTGSVHGLLTMLAPQYRFTFYTQGKDLLLMYHPTYENVTQTEMYTKEPDIVLDSSNMESNPQIGNAEIQVTSNLDNRFNPADILDTSKLVTAGTNADENTLQLLEGYLKDAIAGFSKYQVISVSHQGSNFAKNWTTRVNATAPSRGISMPTYGWF